MDLTCHVPILMKYWDLGMTRYATENQKNLIQKASEETGLPLKKIKVHIVSMCIFVESRRFTYMEVSAHHLANDSTQLPYTSFGDRGYQLQSEKDSYIKSWFSVISNTLACACKRIMNFTVEMISKGEAVILEHTDTLMGCFIRIGLTTSSRRRRLLFQRGASTRAKPVVGIFFSGKK